MAVYVVTGGTGGIGKATCDLLKEEGHEVVNVDVVGGDIPADLSSPEGRQAVIDAIHKKYPDGIDGLLCNAGVNGACGSFPLIVSVNYYGATALAIGLFDLLEKKGGRLLFTVSNTISQNRERLDIAEMMVNGEREETTRSLVGAMNQKDFHVGHTIYVASKIAVAKWVRRVAPTAAAHGVRVNAVAPGNVHTGMTAHMDAASLAAVNALPVPTKYGEDAFMDADELAEVNVFMLGEKSRGINGAIIFVDGGTDALINSERVC